MSEKEEGNIDRSITGHEEEEQIIEFLKSAAQENLDQGDGIKENYVLEVGGLCDNPLIEFDEICQSCEKFDKLYKDLCLRDPCLLLTPQDSSSCYKYVTDILKF